MSPGKRFSPVSLAIAIALIAIMLPGNLVIAAWVFLDPYRAYVVVVPVIAKVATVLLWLAELALAYLAGRAGEWLIGRYLGRRWLRVHLSTCLALAFAAGMLLFLNIPPEPDDRGYLLCGWPWMGIALHPEAQVALGIAYVWPKGMTADILVAVAILLAVIVICELSSSRTDKASTTPSRLPVPLINVMYATALPARLNDLKQKLLDPLGGPPDDRRLMSLTPGVRERWLGFVPFILTGLLLPLAPAIAAVAEESFRANRVELSLPARLMLDWTEMVLAYPWLMGLLFSGGAILYFGWACRSRRRIFWYNLILLAVLFLGIFGLLLAIITPFLYNDHCIVKGALVDGPTGPRPVEDLRVGDAVTTLAADGSLELGTVQSISVANVRRYLILRLDNGISLKVTAEHPIATRDGWVRAHLLKQGDQVRCKGGWATVSSIGPVRGAVSVYDLTVRPNSNFFANGVLVHNALKRK